MPWMKWIAEKVEQQVKTLTTNGVSNLVLIDYKQATRVHLGLEKGIETENGRTAVCNKDRRAWDAVGK